MPAVEFGPWSDPCSCLHRYERPSPGFADRVLVEDVAHFRLYPAARDLGEPDRVDARILVLVFDLGAAFLGLELYEFYHLIHIGATPQTSGFLTAFFALVGTHGLHVLFGIVWLVTLLFQLKKHGLIPANKRRVFCLSMFWHFLDVVWVGVFTFVYLMGVLP